MHSNAANTRRFSYAARFGRGGSLARHMVKLFMAAWMMFGMATSVQAEGSVNQTREKTGFWAMYGANGANSTSTATEVCLAWGRHLLGTTLVFYEFLGTEHNADYFDSMGMLNCIFRDTTTGVIAPNGGIVPVTRGVCPANSTPGSPCTCNTNFKPDPALTSCIPIVQYTIALHDLNVGGELAPDASRAAYAQVMEGAAAKSGIAVTLTTTAPPEAGSGMLSPTTGTTGGDGRLNFSFAAPPVGGTHTITATCDGGKCSNQATETVVVTECPVPPLKPLPANDACTASLEKGLGVDVDGACPKLSDNMKAQMQCFADKITATNVTASPQIPYAGPTATYRTTAYQAHLREIWDKMIDLDLPANKKNEACKTRRAEIVAAKGCNGGHCLEFRPADDSKHSIGQAFDISKSTIQGLLQELTPLPPPAMSRLQKKQEQIFLIANWLAQPTACNLTWGGSFNDRVHFQLP